VSRAYCTVRAFETDPGITGTLAIGCGMRLMIGSIRSRRTVLPDLGRSLALMLFGLLLNHMEYTIEAGDIRDPEFGCSTEK
jgi:hypothetical protein